MQSFVAFLKNETGATAIEYGLIVAFVSLAGVAVFQMLGDNLSTFFSSVSSTVNNAQPGA